MFILWTHQYELEHAHFFHFLPVLSVIVIFSVISRNLKRTFRDLVLNKLQQQTLELVNQIAYYNKAHSFLFIKVALVPYTFYFLTFNCSYDESNSKQHMHWFILWMKFRVFIENIGL